MRKEAFDFVSFEFPWLEDFRKKYNLSKRLNFLETHGLNKPTFSPHIDGKEYNEVMFNVPILNCTTETKTYWVKPKREFNPILLCEDRKTSETKKGATPHLPEDIEFDVVCEFSFTNKCTLFRSNIYHGVINKTNKDQYRIMMHWWFPDYMKFEEAERYYDSVLSS